jgi:hypothetical protein
MVVTNIVTNIEAFTGTDICPIGSSFRCPHTAPFGPAFDVCCALGNAMVVANIDANIEAFTGPDTCPIGFSFRCPYTAPFRRSFCGSI